MRKWRERKLNKYQTGSEQPFRLSRSRIGRFLECQKCFYLDRKLGIDRPSMPGWSLNSAVDTLLKKEFDLLRKKGQKHELMHKYNIDAIPFDHPELPLWRDDGNRYTGAKFLHKETNLEIDGIVDDIWVNPKKELLIVDYKSTSTSRTISLEDEYKQSYKKQIELYQWIFRKKGFKVSNSGYFVFANASKNRPKFDAKLEFDVEILIHEGDDSWVEPTIFDIKKVFDSTKVPNSGNACEYCPYRLAAGNR